MLTLHRDTDVIPNPVFGRSEGFGHPGSGDQFGAMALTIIERQAVGGETTMFGFG